MLIYIEEYFPEAHAKHRPEELRGVIRYGIQIAGTYAVESEDCLERYIHLMFTLGINFDADPLYPWASRILRDEELTEEEARETLTDEAIAEKSGERTPGRA